MFSRSGHSIRALAWSVTIMASVALARDDVPQPVDKRHIVDGSAVLTVGRLHVNVTNWGLIGSRYSEVTTYGDAPSGQWPGGSGEEYLFAGGLWIGGIVQGQVRVSTGQPEAELRPTDGPEDVIYEAREGLLVQPFNPGAGGIPAYMTGGDDDGDGIADEEILDGRDQDGDGRIDEDFAQVGTQMLVCTMRDDTPLAESSYPDHRPLGVRVRQSAYAWQTSEHEDFVALSFTITNVSVSDITELYLGFWADGDIGRRTDPDGSQDDHGGTYDQWVRVPAGYFQPVRGAYMRDGATRDPLRGWIGVQVAHHTIDQDLEVAPYPERMYGAKIIAGASSFWGGPPLNDQERYELMSAPGRDPETRPDRAGDYSMLVTTGPFPLLEPGASVRFDVALVVAEGFDALLTKGGGARDACYGRWYDGDGDYHTGQSGREHLICAEDFYPDWRSPDNPVYTRNSGAWNLDCLPGALVFPDIIPQSFTFDPEIGKNCMYVNYDNCDELERLVGRDILPIGSDEGKIVAADKSWTVQSSTTGISGCEAHAWWMVGQMPTPAPTMRAVPGDGIVRLFWDDRSEWIRDDATDLFEFEAYRLWRSDLWDRPPGSSFVTGPSRDSWRLVAEFDLANQYRQDFPDGSFQMLDLGQNTGLDVIAYRPACLDDPSFENLAGAMKSVVDADPAGEFTYLPALRDATGRPIPALAPLLPWETHRAVLDTFFAITTREAAAGVVPKRAVRYYQYDDRNVNNGYLYFYSVVTLDHTWNRMETALTGYGVQGTPGANFLPATPRFEAAAAPPAEQPEIFVYPNPATRARLDEFQRMYPAAGDATGVRVAFANLPAARSRIEVFTLSGDLVQTIEHDGRDGNGQASWNLISRKGQEIVSGIYLFVVTPDDTRFSPQTGKFVVIR